MSKNHSPMPRGKEIGVVLVAFADMLVLMSTDRDGSRRCPVSTASVPDSLQKDVCQLGGRFR